MLPTGRTRKWVDRRGLPELRTEMDRLLSDFFGQTEGTTSRFAPATDLYETDEHYVVEAELPGLERDDINVTIEQGTLTISGRRTFRDTKEDGANWHMRERATGQFRRSFSLPRSIEADSVNARFENGILTVEVPKAAEARSRQIEVEVS